MGNRLRSILLYNRSEVKLGTFQYGQTIKLQEGNAIVLLTGGKEKVMEKSFSISVIVRPLDAVTGSFKGRLGVKKVGDRTGVVELSIVDPVR